MANQTSTDERFKKIVAHCKDNGFVFQSSELYDGLGAVYDYGPYGSLLKQNIKACWWQAMTQIHENIVGLDAAIFMHPKTWIASGHVEAFNDPMVDNKDSKKRYRADNLIEEQYVDKQKAKIEKEVEKARKRFGSGFDETLFRQTNPRIQDYLKGIEQVEQRLAQALTQGDMAAIKILIEELNIVCPDSGSRNWTDVRLFNLMFSTQGGGSTGDDKLYLRPETAQGIFVNFLNVQRSARQKIPFGIAQIGKAFRNEIVARQFIFRMREFEQMEMQFFVRPGSQMSFYEIWKQQRLAWHQALGLAPQNLKFKDHDNLAHYADAAVDVQYQFPFGFKELEGIHSRTDFDLKAHQSTSGKKVQYFDAELNESYVPYVVETSVGCDRMFLALLCEAYTEESVADAKGEDSSRIVLRLHPVLAPIKCAIFPVVAKDPALVQQAQSIFRKLKTRFQCHYEEKDSIGRRYRRQDQIGTPFCLTVDAQTLEDGSVTLRERDSMNQVRLSIEAVAQRVEAACSMPKLLETLADLSL